ncbi:ABC transporter substrate-binding protein [Halostagnicola sp. A-GB9-2]|nr:ABC transporter substrate-binding protein [Halostagnicola sp. A-GB9-2]MDJ1430583.1 ABC transporter substrate-binding protein [Halostagnicola sp. A-GB9-2]
MTQYTRRRLLAAGLGTAAVGSIAGCSSDTAQSSTIRIGGTYIPESIDPVDHGGGPLGQIGVYESLCRVSPELEIQPQLATDWTVTDDNRTWTFDIRDDVQFHDGTDLTGKSVEHSLSRAFAESSLLSPLPVEEVATTDRYEVQITTTTPFSPLPSYLSHPYASIISSDSTTDSGEFEEPVGTGPYVFESWQMNERLVATKNSDYYESLPQINRVVYEGIQDSQTSVFSLEANELDISYNLSASALEDLSENDDVELSITPTTNNRFLAYNVRRPPFDDVRVRKAVNHAIDMQTIVETVLSDLGSAAVGPFDPSVSDWANTSLEPYEYDPERARALLEDAGWEATPEEGTPRQRDGTPFEIVLRTYTRQPELELISEVIQDQLSEVGIDIEILVTEVAAIQEDMEAGEFDVGLWSYNFFWVADPDRAMTFYHSTDSQIHTGYDNPEADELIERGRRVTDVEERKEIYDELQTIVHDDTPLGMLTYKETVSGTRNRVKNFDVHPTMYTHGLRNLRLQ